MKTPEQRRKNLIEITCLIGFTSVIMSYLYLNDDLMRIGTITILFIIYWGYVVYYYSMIEIQKMINELK